MQTCKQEIIKVVSHLHNGRKSDKCPDALNNQFYLVKYLAQLFLYYTIFVDQFDLLNDPKIKKLYIAGYNDFRIGKRLYEI